MVLLLVTGIEMVGVILPTIGDMLYLPMLES